MKGTRCKSRQRLPLAEWVHPLRNMKGLDKYVIGYRVALNGPVAVLMMESVACCHRLPVFTPLKVFYYDRFKPRQYA